MDKFALSKKIGDAATIDKGTFIIKKCRGRDVLDLGCIRHSADFAFKDPNWLHKKIKYCARSVVGVDCAGKEAKKLKDYGYDIICADVPGKFDIDGKFDVIVASDLIEHLVNFEGFFANCKKLLKPGGRVIITTPNPFYIEGIHYLIFKRSFTVNPEHTCWVDPLCLAQLSKRFGFEIEEIHYLKNSWGLKDIICESKNNPYDILNDRWQDDTFRSRAFRLLLKKLFILVYLPFKLISCGTSRLIRNSDYLAVLKEAEK